MNGDLDQVRSDWRNSPEYAGALEHRLRGEWAQALTLLRELQARVGAEDGLTELITDTQLRLEAARSGPWRGRRFRGPSRRTVFLGLLLVVLVALALAASAIYRNVVAPSLTQLRVEQGRAELARQAQNALAAGEYEKALALYDRLAADDPQHPALAEGRTKAQEAKALEQAYKTAEAQLAAGQLSEAQATLIGIQQVAPRYRDVGVLLSRIERQQRLAALLRDAAADQATGNWEGVISRLEEARTLTQGEERTRIEADLYTAYMALAGQLTARSEGGIGELNRAIQTYSKALSLRPGAAEATTQRSWLRQYVAGAEAVSAGRWETAIAQLEPLYTARPDFLAGRAAQLLYTAYVRMGDLLLSQDEVVRAWERFQRASQIQGVDTSSARAMAASLSLRLTPTPTPTPTQTPTVAPTATLAPTPTPTPPYVPLSRYRGKIAFFSNRGGSVELWIMDADGKNAFRPWHQDRLKAEYAQMYEAEKRSPDGRSRVAALTPRGSKNVQLFIIEPDGRNVQITDWRGICYDPVWSPAGHWIAFVSTEPGNDEIFVIGADGERPRRLTWNEWEWDKHPSWAPGGGRLVFWSNRHVGRGQIWLMNDDGSGQVNLSNNQFEDTDPLWIK